MIRYVAYVPWDSVPHYEAAGWMHSTSTLVYPRLAAHGTTMSWEGDGKPPVPQSDEEAVL